MKYPEFVKLNLFVGTEEVEGGEMFMILEWYIIKWKRTLSLFELF